MKKILLSLFMFFISTDVFAYSYYAKQTSALDRAVYGLIVGALVSLVMYILYYFKGPKLKEIKRSLFNNVKKLFKFNRKTNLVCLTTSIILIGSIILFIEYNRTVRSLLCGNCWFSSPWENNYFIIIFSMFLALIIPYIVAIIIKYIPSSKYISCPYCGEKILGVAKKCKHCGEWINKK